ncbi:MAG TPA: archease, partial [Methanoregulaceae archaeon]|nr:archease [Methanoregulaceae archaeon]
MSFEELEHTADIRIRVRGTTLEELFSEAARAL